MNPTKAIDELIKLSNSIKLIKSSDTGQAVQYAIDILKMFEHSTTNGDVMMSVFPDSKIEHKGKHIVFAKLGGSFVGYEFDGDWWDAPYKTESEDKE